MKNAKYTAIIGDLVKSRRISNRQEIQDYLWRGLQTLNYIYKKVIISEFVLVGDEFQGIASLNFPLREFLWYYDDRILDVKTRFGVGVGGLSTDINVIAIEMDGPCLHSARKAINQAKSQKERIVVDGYEEKERQKFLNICLSLASAIENSWTERQRFLVKAILGGKAQHSLATKLNVSRQAVQLQLSRASWREFKEGWDVITYYMNPKRIYSFSKSKKAIELLMKGLTRRWTKRQIEVFENWENEDYSLKRVAEILKINYRTVSKILRAAHYKSYFNAKSYLKDIGISKRQ